MFVYNNVALSNTIPDEITLEIEIIDDFSKMKDLTRLDVKSYEKLVRKALKKNPEITCVCFVGGEKDPIDVNILAYHSNMVFDDLKVAWWTKYQKLAEVSRPDYFDYVRVEKSIYMMDGAHLTPIMAVSNESDN